MSPDENTIKVGLDPVFKSNSDSQKKIPEQNITASAFNVLNNQEYTPAKQPPTIPNPLDLTKNNSASPKSIVRTYKGDLESAIQANHLSSINIAIAENQKMRDKIADQGTETGENSYSKSRVIIFISLILIILGIIGISLTYFFKNQNSDSTVKVQTLPALITTEYKGELNISLVSKDKLISNLAEKLNDTQIPVNNLYNVYLTTGTGTARRLITPAEFISNMKLQTPDIIARTLLPDFMVGMYLFERNLPFAILKTSSFENTYAGMLDWEKNLEQDFKGLFRLPGYEKSGGILDELTPTTAKKFEDGIILNKDVRLLHDENNNIILLYGIIDKETVVITVSETAFKEIISRLNKEKTLQR